MPTSLRLLLLGSCLLVSVRAASDSGSIRSSNNSAASGASRSEGSGAQSPSPALSTPSAAFNTTTDPSYKLNIGDTVYISIGTHANPTETSTSVTIGKRGDVRLPWIDDEIPLNGKSVRDTEYYLEKLYKDRKLLNRPVVIVKVSNYFPREVSVLGAVRSPGMVPFPPDTVTWDIGEVIMKVGGFSTIAKANQVTVTHREENGKETSVTLDLESLATGRNKKGKDRGEFPIYPGDRIWVPESIF